jgi:hypothetical protein
MGTSKDKSERRHQNIYQENFPRCGKEMHPLDRNGAIRKREHRKRTRKGEKKR